jgi:hypothetical protein
MRQKMEVYKKMKAITASRESWMENRESCIVFRSCMVDNFLAIFARHAFSCSVSAKDSSGPFSSLQRLASCLALRA